MFRDLACMTASLKGPRYEGALIAKAVWECGHDAGAGMRILRDHHGLLEVMAFDDSGRLTLTMLLGRPAPSRPSGRLVRSRLCRGFMVGLLGGGALSYSWMVRRLLLISRSVSRRSRSTHSCSPSAIRMRSMRGQSRLCRGWPSSKPHCRASRRCAVRSCASAVHP